MSELGAHPVTRSVLSEIVDREYRALKRFARSRGVQAADLDDVIQDAFVSVSRLGLRGDIAALVDRWQPTPAHRDRLEKNLIALFMLHLKFRIIDHLRRQSRRQGPIPLEVVASTAPAQDDMRRVLAEIFASEDVDLDGFMDGDLGALRQLCETLYDRAGLTDIERRYARFRYQNPGALEREFDAGLRPYQVTRIKMRTFSKIRGFLESGGP